MGVSTITYASFDEVPSLKGASHHILSGLRRCTAARKVNLISLGASPLEYENLRHFPQAISEPNTLKRGLAFRTRVRQLLRRNPSDLIHFRSPWEGLAALEAGVPTVYEVNGLPSVELPYHYEKISEAGLKLFRSWELVCLQQAGKIICPSEHIREFIGRLVPGREVEVLRNAYDPVDEQFLRAEPVRERRTESGTECGIALVYIGTLSEWQGVYRLLTVIQSANAGLASGQKIQLDIFAPHFKQSWRRMSRRIERLGLGGCVRLLPALNRRELAETLPRYHAGIAPFERSPRNTEQGCFPLKILDYLAHGLPVLASDLPITRQLLTPEVNAMLYDAGNLQALQRLIEQVAQAPEGLLPLRNRAVQSLNSQWTWDEYGARLLRLYEEVEAKAST